MTTPDRTYGPSFECVVCHKQAKVTVSLPGDGAEYCQPCMAKLVNSRLISKSVH